MRNMYATSTPFINTYIWRDHIVTHQTVIFYSCRSESWEWKLSKGKSIEFLTVYSLIPFSGEVDMEHALRSVRAQAQGEQRQVLWENILFIVVNAPLRLQKTEIYVFLIYFRFTTHILVLLQSLTDYGIL